MALEKKYYSGSQVFDIIRELPDKEFLLMLNAFAKASGADVVERKAGKWTYDDEAYPGGNPYGHYVCDQCGECVPHKTKFCPNCGARMDERRDDD